MATSTSLPSRPRAGLLRRLRRRAFRALPLLAWSAAVAGLVLLWNERSAMNQVKGLAEASSFAIAPPLDGRILELAVGLGQSVEAGQVVVRLEDEPIRLRLRRARHELERLRSELSREDALLKHEWQRDLLSRDFARTREAHRHARDMEAARLERLATRAELEETRIRHRGVRDELDRQRPLQESGILSGSLLCQLETEAQALGKRVEELSTLLQARETRLSSARERLESFLWTSELDPVLAPSQLGPFEWRIREQEVALDEILHEIDACALKAPANGIVAGVTFGPGAFVRRGTPILTIVEPRAPMLTAYVPEGLWRAVGPTPLIHLEFPDRPGVLHEARLLGVTPNLVPVPERLWTDPRVEEWALGVRLEATGDELPGQAVRVYLRKRPVSLPVPSVSGASSSGEKRP